MKFGDFRRSFGQGGAVGACECEHCSAARKADGGSGTIGQGGQSGLSLATANALAVGIAKEFPEVRVMVEAYQDKAEPPTSTSAHDNVHIHFCTLSSNFGQPLTHPSNNITRVQLETWAKIAPGRVHVWDCEPTRCAAKCCLLAHCLLFAQTRPISIFLLP